MVETMFTNTMKYITKSRTNDDPNGVRAGNGRPPGDRILAR